MQLAVMANLSSLGRFYTPSRSLAAWSETAAAWETSVDAPAPAGADEIADRLLAAMSLPALELAADHVADPGEIDRGAVMALKFAEGPYTLMARWPKERLAAAIEAICRRDHHPPPSTAIAAMA
jgi:3-hydroxybutyryl-CoA dehydrogenase